MVATQSFSISRRTLDVEDYIDIARRHVGWIVGPAFLGLVASICVAFMLPNEYTSRAAMQIQPAEVGDNVVQSTISNSLMERIQQMETQIESHTELSAIIFDPHLNLYPDERKTVPLEDVIDEMKQNIHIDFVTLPGAMGKRAAAFNISFNYKDRYKAKATVEALISKFEEKNTETQRTDQNAVTGLVADMLTSAKAAQNDANDKLTAFKEGNQGKLPEDVPINMARETGYGEKIKSDNDAIFRDQNALEQLDYDTNTAKGKLDLFDEQQAEMEDLAPSANSPVAKQNKDLADFDAKIADLQFTLEQLRRQYKPGYPPLDTATKQVQGYIEKRAELAKQIKAKEAADAAEAAANAAKPKKDVPKTLAAMKEKQVRQGVDNDLAAYDLRRKTYTAEIARLKAEIDNYKKASDETEQMLKDSTGIEAEYEELKQNKALADQQVVELEKKQQLADANSQLIDRNVGEILDVLDTATLPSTPTKPNRYMIVGAGFAMSMILGLGMAGLQEAKDTSLKNLKDVRAYTNLPVLCSIPLLENTMLVKRKRRLTYLAWSAAVLVGVAAVSGAVAYYYTFTMKT